MESAGQVQVLRLSVYFHKNSSRSSISFYHDSRVAPLIFFFLRFIKITAQHQHFFFLFLFTLKPARFSFEHVSLKLRRLPARFSAVLSLFLPSSPTHSFLLDSFSPSLSLPPPTPLSLILLKQIDIAVVTSELKKHALFSVLLFGICNTTYGTIKLFSDSWQRVLPIVRIIIQRFYLFFFFSFTDDTIIK